MSRKLDLCGDPNNPAAGTFFAGADPSLVSPISSPDHLTLDGKGEFEEVPGMEPILLS